jgi:nucleoside-diphosphate-sugar epimerase
MKILVAGATGALGRQLLPRLVASGHEVAGMTRSAAKRELVRALGATPVVAEALDSEQVTRAVAEAEPDVIVHQLTALAGSLDMRHFDRQSACRRQGSRSAPVRGPELRGLALRPQRRAGQNRG